MMRRISAAERLLSPGVGTEGADESYVPLEWVAPEAQTQSAASSCAAKSGMNTTAVKNREKPAPDDR